MRRGLLSRRLSYPKPSLSSAPGRKFSVSTSLRSMSFSTRERPSGCLRSMAKLFLLRLNTGKKPAPACSRRRVLSPSSGSTFMTSAPRSASMRPQEGPITMCANSTTRTPSSSGTESFGQAGERHMAVHRFVGNGFHHELARRKQLVEINAGRDAHRLEHEDQVFGDHVAARARCERAAAEAAERAVEMSHPFLVRGERVGEAKAARVVEVRALQLFTDALFYPAEEAAHLRRVRVADRIGECHAVAELGQPRGDAHHVVLGHYALHRAAEGGGNGAFDLDAGMRELGALAHFVDHLLGRHAHVGLAVLAARRHGE